MCSVNPDWVIDGAPFAPRDTSDPWQSERLQSVDGVCFVGGIPWHAPHLACAPDVSFQAGTAAGSARFAPWQATFVHWVAVPGRERATRRGEPREGHVHRPVEVHGIEDGARNDVAVACSRAAR